MWAEPKPRGLLICRQRSFNFLMANQPPPAHRTIYSDVFSFSFGTRFLAATASNERYRPLAPKTDWLFPFRLGAFRFVTSSLWRKSRQPYLNSVTERSEVTCRKLSHSYHTMNCKKLSLLHDTSEKCRRISATSANRHLILLTGHDKKAIRSFACFLCKALFPKFF